MMTTSHLSDTEIQEYLVDQFSINPVLQKHIAECPICKAKVANYQAIFQQLNQLDKPSFNFDVSALVLEKLSSKQVKRYWLTYNAVGMSLIICLVTLLFFGNYIASVFKDLSFLSVCILVIPALCVVLFQSMEMWKAYRKQLIVLNSYNLLQP